MVPLNLTKQEFGNLSTEEQRQTLKEIVKRYTDKGFIFDKSVTDKYSTVDSFEYYDQSNVDPNPVKPVDHENTSTSRPRKRQKIDE